MSLPATLHPLFWDCRPEALDREAHAPFIVERVLEYGSLAAVRWAARASGAASPQSYTPAHLAERILTSRAALDLLRYVEHAGFLSNVATVLRDLAEACDPRRLVKAAEADGELAYAQRLGYLLDLVGVRRLADPLAQWLETRSPSVVRLNPAEPERGAPRDRRWRLIVNDTVEPDT